MCVYISTYVQCIWDIPTVYCLWWNFDWLRSVGGTPTLLSPYHLSGKLGGPRRVGERKDTNLINWGDGEKVWVKGPCGRNEIPPILPWTTQPFTHRSAPQSRWRCCISVCRRGTCGRPFCKCWPPSFPLRKRPSRRRTRTCTDSEGIHPSVSWDTNTLHTSKSFHVTFVRN